MGRGGVPLLPVKLFAISVLISLSLFAGTAYALGCNPGTSECYNDSAYHSCDEHALWGDPVDCPSGSSCVLGACEAPIGCKPGTRECTSSSTYHVCNGYALWDPETQCNPGWTCENGQCMAPKPTPQCSTPGQTRCAPDGSNIVQVCNGNLQWQTQQTCDYGCVSGYCKTCSPSATRCSDRTHYQTCNSDGTWGGSYYCGQDNICQGGSCVPDPSTRCQSIGSVRCSPSNSNMLQKCGANYIWGDFQVCQLGCFYNACRVCSTGDKSCRDSETYYVCNSQGQWGLATSCPDGYVCFLGSCQAPSGNQCSSVGQKRCSPTTPSMTQICGSNYVYMDYVECGQGCSNGECMACQPGSTACADSASYKSCNGNGQYSSPIPCAAGQSCSNGQCVKAIVCSEGARQCAGNTVQVCSGGQWTTYTNCPSDSTCTELQGTAYCKANPAPAPSPSPTPTPTPSPTPEPQKSGGVSGMNMVELALALGVIVVIGGAGYYLFTRPRKNRKN